MHPHSSRIHCAIDLSQNNALWFPFTDHPSVNKQLGHMSSLIQRGFISEPDVVSFLFFFLAEVHSWCDAEDVNL